MAKQYRINNVAKKFNVSISKILEILNEEGQDIILKEDTRLNKLQFDILTEKLALNILEDSRKKRSSKIFWGIEDSEIIKIFNSKSKVQYYPDSFNNVQELTIEEYISALDHSSLVSISYVEIKSFLKGLIKRVKIKNRLIDFRNFISTKILIQIFYNFNTEEDNNNEVINYKLHYC